MFVQVVGVVAWDARAASDLSIVDSFALMENANPIA